jgi:hypothetical protein
VSFDLAIQNGDLVLQNGDLAQVTGQTKLIQDLLKIALTTLGANPLQPWYGSLISRTLIGSVLASSITTSVAQTQLQTAIQNLQNLQNLQVQSGQPVTPDEQIAFIKNISITRSPVDFRLYQVVIQVLNRAFGTTSASFTANNM